MLLKNAKRLRYGDILNSVRCNSQKNTTIERSVLQIGLILPIGHLARSYFLGGGQPLPSAVNRGNITWRWILPPSTDYERELIHELVTFTLFPTHPGPQQPRIIISESNQTGRFRGILREVSWKNPVNRSTV